MVNEYVSDLMMRLFDVSDMRLIERCGLYEIWMQI